MSSGQISPEGLMFYLMGSETSIIIQDRLATCNDMTQPIPHYFIKSSHNTDLTGQAGPFSCIAEALSKHHFIQTNSDTVKGPCMFV